MLTDLFEYKFLQYALVSGILASCACGIIGVIIVEKKMIMMSGGIAHTSYGGVGLGYLLNFEPIIGAFLFALAAAFGIGYLRRRGGERFDVIVGLFWSLGMALGILFIALMPGYPPDLNSYLFGNILTVTEFDLWLMFALTLFVVLIVAAFFNTWKAYLFDEEYTEISGFNTRVLEYLLLLLVSMSVVVLIRAVGIILALALLTAPAATSALLTSRLSMRMVLSVLIGCFFCIAGLWLSYIADIASGAAIVMLSAVCYFTVYIIKSRVRGDKKHG